MRRIDEFRLFYNHTIQPELVRMERVRKRLLFLLTISAVVLVVFVFISDCLLLHDWCCKIYERSKATDSTSR